MTENPIIVALDVPDLDTAIDLSRQLSGHVGGFKVGLELLMAAGSDAVGRVAAMGHPVFADAKLHDIPNTVERAARSLGTAGARWVTVHAYGGDEMIAAAVSGLGSTGGVLGVTVLTSQPDVGQVADEVLRLARTTTDSGGEGIVCAASEVAVVKSRYPVLSVFTPGIRPAGAPVDDQQRVGTPVGALSAGADYLVIGRPITRAADPVAAIQSILTEIGR